MLSCLRKPGRESVLRYDGESYIGGGFSVHLNPFFKRWYVKIGEARIDIDPCALKEKKVPVAICLQGKTLEIRTNFGTYRFFLDLGPGTKREEAYKVSGNVYYNKKVVGSVLLG